jgi:tRNA (uracil-5-)-methyltransferase TRM9
MRAEPQLFPANVLVRPAEPPTTREMIQAYEEYFRSGVYAARYPVANEHSLDVILAHGGREARRILDFGCGTGRYITALLRTTAAEITGFDVCPAAIQGLKEHLTYHPEARRVQTVLGSFSQLESQAPFDVAICMFGVLSHIVRRPDRVQTLKRLGQLLTPEGRLIVSVPNANRRRILEQAKRRLQVITEGPPMDGSFRTGDVTYTRTLGDQKVELFYHLYTLERFQSDLTKAGFDIEVMQPESVFPEAGITHSRWLNRIDSALLKVCPTALGYDLLAVAKPR